jgi:predicted short-subunit dehydrogenase-like oxidoreductase (DUF2520 family)
MKIMKNSIFIIGSGAVGTSLGKALSLAGVEIIGIHDLNSKTVKEAASQIGTKGYTGSLPEILRDAQTVFVTVPDGIINNVAQLVNAEELYSPSQVWIHCSGHLSHKALDSLKDKVKGLASMHPAFTFPPNVCSEIVPGTYFSIDGTTEGISQAEEFVSLLKGKQINIKPADRSTYHAAMVMASNYLVTLLSSSKELLKSINLPEEQVDPLLFSLASSALARVESLGISSSLCGPVRRGDVGVVKDHLESLKTNKLILDLYIFAGRATLKIAASQPRYCQDTAQTLMELFDSYSPENDKL